MTGINNIANEQYDFIPPYRELVRNLTTWYKKSTDGVHLAGKGYDVWAEEVARFLLNDRQ